MEIIHSTSPGDIRLDAAKEKVVALGYFDGVHKGHQKVIKTAVDIAKEKGMQSVVMTFHPHPSVVLSPKSKRKSYITPPDVKAELFAELGIDVTYFIHFDLNFSRLSPQEFVDYYLIKLHAKHIVAGDDFTFGQKAAGNMVNINDYSRSMFNHTTVPFVNVNGEKVSSTIIRSLIEEGDFSNVSTMLGRQYEIRGTVVHGDKRGRLLGFPTANVSCSEEFIIPKNGVYLVNFDSQGRSLNGICSVGVRPTFFDKEVPVTVEVYILDFHGDLYDQEVKVSWIKRLRDEEKFDSAEALIQRMEQDKKEAAAFFMANGRI
ncbi:bifunctional riboflavin kinase/FAD synthetase [Terrilactibacillus laevilacticus]|uniref:Riboflavin biosynthesis protein n=1 Tax=Terrilactibacillus laevilacticus TaxID=1380157 RepID=A0ABW5PPR4_9BACI|nr:bifunctional riboflavin kinase/FAD synthetase [Terrilactibacillus laevilacticus]